MDQKVIDFNLAQRTKEVPPLKAGDVINVHKRIKEGVKERVQVFKGMIISIKGKQSSSPMITVRHDSQGIGTEITFPLYLPTIEKIELLRHSKVRRAKLYYMRERFGKSAKMKVQELTETEKEIVSNLNKKAKAKSVAEKATEQKK